MINLILYFKFNNKYTFVDTLTYTIVQIKLEILCLLRLNHQMMIIDLL